MLRSKRLRYGGAAVIGFIGGALLFVLQQLALRTDSGDQLQELLAATAGGVLVACAFVFLWNRAWQRAHDLHDQRREICLTRDQAGMTRTLEWDSGSSRR